MLIVKIFIEVMYFIFLSKIHSFEKYSEVLKKY